MASQYVTWYTDFKFRITKLYSYARGVEFQKCHYAFSAVGINQGTLTLLMEHKASLLAKSWCFPCD
jgi:hypothetical protein